jgi:hypothetical protein
MHQALDKVMKIINATSHKTLKFMKFEDFHEIEEIGSGAYGTVYTATCKNLNKYVPWSNRQRLVVLKQFKSFNQMSELFVSEVSKLVMLSVY